jgi:SAM-dependent methyltransferase
MNCRFCTHELHEILDLGHQPPSNALLTKAQLDEPEITYPLKVFFCEGCGLLQVPEYAKAKDIFNDEYPYYSSQSPSNVSHAKEFADMICKRFNPQRVLEIGSNDGYMLQWFKEKGCDVEGVDPSKGPTRIAWERDIPTAPDFFTRAFAEGRLSGSENFDLICSINTIAHQPDINDFVEGMKIALAPRGVITAEFPHLMKTISGCQFDQFYHEHYNYYSLTTLCTIFEWNGLEIFDVDEIPEHGGSLRIYAQHKGGTQQRLASVSQVIRKELFGGMMQRETYEEFAEQVISLRDRLREVVWNAKDIIAYGAAAKGNTLLNFCRFTKGDIPLVLDRSPHKSGKYLPGSHIPIIEYDEAFVRRATPKYVLVLPWNLKDEIIQQLSFIRGWGGKFIIPIPNSEVI